MLEGLQQLQAAALGGTTPIRRHGHQHDRLARSQAPDPVLHQHGQDAMPGSAAGRQSLQLTFGHAGVMLQLQGDQRGAIPRQRPDASDELAFRRSDQSVIEQLLLPTLKLLPGKKGLDAEIKAEPGCPIVACDGWRIQGLSHR